MKTVLFIDTHLGSESERLYTVLDTHPRVQGYRENRVYENVASLFGLTSLPHKNSTAAAVYMDEVVHNHALAHRSIYPIPHHVFLIRDPVGTLNQLHSEGMDFESACRYYCLRLRRLGSVARHASRAVALLHDDLVSGRIEPVNRLLRLRPPLELPRCKYTEVRGDAPYRLVQEGQESFERCLLELRSLGLLSSPE